jgi:hypothetical protein
MRLTEQQYPDAHLKSLLSQLHRDNGQYLETHGMDQAVKSAGEIVMGLQSVADHYSEF